MTAPLEIQNAFEAIRQSAISGQVAAYIPELRDVNPTKFGVAYTGNDGDEWILGDALEAFSTQSVIKVFSLAMAYREMDHTLWQRVGVEPSGNRFNSLMQLEVESGIPRNPFINAGALVICDCLLELLTDPVSELLDFVRTLSGDHSIEVDPSVAASEQRSGFRNKALINYIKSFGNIHHDPDQLLDVYVQFCAIRMSCQQLSRAFRFLAQNGRNPVNGEAILSNSQCKRINALMMTCGFYDEAGEFAFKVGLPGKSGVGGGIVAVLPESFTIAVWSPPLNEHGNSERGLRFLEAFTTETGTSVF